MTIVHLNESILNDLSFTLEEEFPPIIDSYLETSAKILATIPESLLKEDVHAFTIKIHSLKGSCRNVGADHLAELCSIDEAFVKDGLTNKIDPSLTEIKKEFEIVKIALLAYING